MGWFGKLLAVAIGVACAAGWLSLLSWSSGDPSLNYVATGITRNFVGHPGAVVSDLLMQMIGLACIALFLPPAFWALHLLSGRRISGLKAKIIAVPVAILLVAAALSSLPTPATWPLRHGFGGMLGDMGLAMSVNLIGAALPIHAPLAAGAMCFVLGTLMLLASLGMSRADLVAVFVPSRSDVLFRAAQRNRFALWRRQPETHGSLYPGFSPAVDRSEAPLSSVPRTAPAAAPVEPYFESAARTQPTLAIDPVLPVPRDAPAPKLHEPALHAPAPRTPVRDVADPAPVLPPVEADDIDDPFDTTTGQIARRFAPDLGQGAEPAAPVAPIAVAPAPQQTYAPAPRRRASGYGRPSVNMLKRPPAVRSGPESSQSALRGTARLLEDVLADFGVKGEIKDIRPGPVVTLFELEPARGTKSSRVIGLADDIARSMSALSVRVAVVPGRNVIGIELPNVRRETVYLRELLESDAFCRSEAALPLTLGKTIGGDPIVTDLARMPHLLVAGTTGSGKSVGVNAMILSLLYRHTPDQCRFLMIDPKMLELSVYNGIPHLLTPVVTDPQKAVAALHWAV
ncbi:MAG: DNA translocase FtsK 4TM domain-containing protein, partial [Hyphomicrobiaceae bacterium]